MQADKIVGASDAFLVLDDTGLLKKGDHSVGVAPQYASMLGKRANCQTLMSLTLVSLTLARDEVSVPVGLRLFLPERSSDLSQVLATALTYNKQTINIDLSIVCRADGKKALRAALTLRQDLALSLPP